MEGSIDEKLRRLTISRRAHRGQMTKLINRARDVSSVLDNTSTAQEKQALVGLVDSMQTKLGVLLNIDQGITDMTTEEFLEDAIIEADDYIEEVKVRVRAMKMVNDNLNDVATSSMNDPVSDRKRTVNLPKLQLPKFDGNLLKWISFYDAFTAAVHNDAKLEDVQKFQYLRCQLTGEAAHTIEGLQLTNCNYSEAIALLKKRYGQNHKLISCYMKALWELAKPNNDITSIKAFYDNVESYIRGLRSLGKTEETYGDLLLPIIFEKLPGPIKTQISREHGDQAWTLTEVMEAIDKEVQATQAGLGYANTEVQDATFSAAFHVGTKRPATTKIKNKKTYTMSPCVFCKGSHFSNDCVKVTDVQKRRDIVKGVQLCFNCLKGRHYVRECQAKGRCQRCQSKHHTSLCHGRHSQSSDSRQFVSHKQPTHDTHVKLTPACLSPSGPVLLKTATCTLWSDNTTVTVNILLDEGAQRTFITEGTVRRLMINQNQCQSEDINLSTFGASHPTMKRVDVANVQLETISGEMIDLSALVVPKISTPVKNYVPATILKHTYLKDLPLAKHVEKDIFEIDLLIGSDYYWTIVQDAIVRGAGPTAVASRIGFLLSGPTNLTGVSNLNTMIYKVMVSSSGEESALSTYWDLETVGIKDELNVKPCEFEKYRDTQLHLHNKKYTAALPWKDDHPPLPTNFDICNRRTRSMVKRLPADILSTYDGIISDQLSRNFIEPILIDDKTRGHYIPHHSVHKNSSTTPIRVVYDCSCKQGSNPSLNDCLDTGPSLINDLVAMLMRFRLHPIGFVSDIEKAFLNIQLEEDDRDYTKFLWLSDPTDPDSDFNVYRFKAILFGAVSSPFILNAVIKTHLENEPDTMTEDLLDNIYVDNLVSGVNTESEAIAFYKNSVDLLKQAGFRLRSWATNNIALRGITVKDGNQDNNTSVKVLGLEWQTDSDVLSYSPNTSSLNSNVHTKREVVRVTSSLFDPLGFLSPVHIQAKIFIQKLWQLKQDWDEALSDQLVDEWKNILNDLNSVRSSEFNRQYFSTDSCDVYQDYELHVFADASCKAYGTVIYLKRGVQTAFVISKCRVKPLKDVTVPRLELLGAFIATRLALFVTNALSQLKFTKIILWSDSQIVLHWIRSEKKLPMFVENRVKVIRSGPFSDIKYCPSKENPADLLTRGISSVELSQSNLWSKGPSWLPQGDWPICDLFVSDTSVHVDMIEPGPDDEPEHIRTPGIDHIIDIKRFNSMGKLLRVTAYVLRFIDILKKRSTKSQVKPFVSVNELNITQKLWIRSIQITNYTREMDTIHNKVNRKQTLVRQLNLFLDEEQLLRCGGRLANANIKFNSKYPILIPRKHHFTTLVVKQAHAHVLHAGPGTTVTFIRNTFWIPQIRQVVKTVLRTCVTCLKVGGKSYKMPVTPPLPKFRLKEAPPFTICGVDFTGALFYKSTQRKDNKAYICLFTCAVTRAIHLEVVADMTTDSFLRAFRRFAARRSLPSHMVSDNGSTFIAAVEEIQKLFKEPSVNNYLAKKGVQWTFIPKRAPWFGGFYERLIGITKSTLKKTLGRSLVNLDELATIVAEIEAVINDRPITYISTDIGELDPLSPSMLLCGRTITVLPRQSISLEELDDPSYGVTQTVLQKRSMQLDKLFNQCWLRWRDEYLPSLREAHMQKAKNRGQSVNRIKVGDVVLVHSDNDRRVQWPLAIVTKLKLGNDGLVRSAAIKTKFGLSNRPITKLYPIEVQLDSDTSYEDK